MKLKSVYMITINHWWGKTETIRSERKADIDEIEEAINKLNNKKENIERGMTETYFVGQGKIMVD